MMLELSNSLGVQNTISLDVWSRIYANTISSFQRYNQKGQFTPNFNSDWKGTSYSIKFTSQLTGEVLLKRIDSSNNNFPRSTEFKIYISEENISNHFKLDLGLYNYELYFTSGNVTDSNASKVIGMVANGIALVHDKNWTNKSFANSPSGVEPTTIPSSVSYNG